MENKSLLNKVSLMTFQLLPEEIFLLLNPEKTVKMAKDNGISYLDIMNISEKKAEAYKSAMEKYGVASGCYIESIPCFKNKKNRSEKFASAVNKAKSMNGNKLMLVAVGDGEKPVGTKSEIREELKAYFKEAVAVAEKEGVSVTFENSPNPYSCMQSAEDCVWLMKEVKGLSLAFDTGLPLSYGEDPLAFYHAVKPFVKHVHIRDAVGQKVSTCEYGKGDVPVKELLSALIADGYEGLLAMEYSRPAGLLHTVNGFTKHFKAFLPFFE